MNCCVLFHFVHGLTTVVSTKEKSINHIVQIWIVGTLINIDNALFIFIIYLSITKNLHETQIVNSFGHCEIYSQ